jgi:hypothetical protein
MRRTIGGQLAALLVLAGAAPAHGDATEVAHGAEVAGVSEVTGVRPDLDAVRVDEGAVRLDGRLDEPVWERAPLIRDLRRAKPVEDGRAGYGAVEVRVLYDRKALYVGARIRQAPGVLRAHVHPRDSIGQDDSLNLYLKPMRGSEVGYILRVNPLGVQRDILVVGYDKLYPSWDGVWDAKTVVLPDGYTVEIRIPFRTLRLSRQQVQDWGLGVGVFTGAEGQTDLWPEFSSDRGSHLDQLAVVRGMEGLEAGHNLDLLPSLVARYGGAAAPGSELDRDPLVRLRRPGVLDPGLDVRYGITPGTTASLTLNPDFSQVEADADQLDYNARYPLRLQEKRPFFLDGNHYFETPVSLLYTRSVNDPVAGVRLTGSEGRISLGLLSIWDLDPPPSRHRGEPGEMIPASGFEDGADADAITTAARLGVDATDRARFGLFFADKQMIGRDGARLAGHDLLAGDTRLNVRDVYFLTAQAGVARTGAVGGEQLDDGFGYLDARREDRRLTVSAELGWYGPRFRAETSQLSRIGYAPAHLRGAYKIETKRDHVDYVQPELALAAAHDATTFAARDRSATPLVTVSLAGHTVVSGGVTVGEETYVARRYPVRQAQLVVTSAPAGWLETRVVLQGGSRIHYDPEDPFLGRGVDGLVDATLRLTQRSEIGLSYAKSLLYRDRSAGREADVDLARIKLLYHLDMKWSLRAISQVSSLARTVRSSLLLSYQHKPGTALYVGYQDRQPYDGEAMLGVDRHVFVKVSWLGWL